MIERLRRLPNSVRRYRCSARFAELHFGLGASALRELIAKGLPCTGLPADPHVEYGDLHYLGLRLGTARTYLWGLSRWAESLQHLAGRENTEVTVLTVPHIERAAPATSAQLRLADGRQRALVLRPGRAVFDTCGVMFGDWPPLPSPARQIATEIAHTIDFYFLPSAARYDAELVRESGLSDCFSASPVILEELERAGLEARITQGLLVSSPYSMFHCWPEVRVGERWVPIDPVTVRLMNKFGGLPEDIWPPDRSNGAMLLRLDAPLPTLTADAGVVQTKLITSITGGDDTGDDTG